MKIFIYFCRFCLLFPIGFDESKFTVFLVQICFKKIILNRCKSKAATAECCKTLCLRCLWGSCLHFCVLNVTFSLIARTRSFGVNHLQCHMSYRNANHMVIRNGNQWASKNHVFVEI